MRVIPEHDRIKIATIETIHEVSEEDVEKRIKEVRVETKGGPVTLTLAKLKELEPLAVLMENKFTIWFVENEEAFDALAEFLKHI